MYGQDTFWPGFGELNVHQKLTQRADALNLQPIIVFRRKSGDAAAGPSPRSTKHGAQQEEEEKSQKELRPSKRLRRVLPVQFLASYRG